MSLFNRLFRSESARQLLGTWRQANDHSVIMTFFQDGRLEYRTRENDKLQIMILTYRIDGAEIISDQPSAPHEERTRFAFEEEDTLVLTHGGEETRFKRVARVQGPTRRRS
jgi:hypothetical protein